eukprot:TRINITY_DN6780_c0_g1_i1.p1 TRINITY_DN6780_c0_g1~~TRINITY_DN6780_c0_g1_i1.p1  ORF type:complete len:216 (+),score=48.60 TRINITY_DN6780_c0_g1_i1:446-1093(+)
MAAFLATPEEHAEDVEDLGAALLSSAGELQAAQSCALGELGLQLLFLLLMEPKHRKGHIKKKGNEIWERLFSVPWDEVRQSGWPLFALLRRVSTELRSQEEGGDEEKTPMLELSKWLPLSGCKGKTEGEDSLDAAIAVLISSTTAGDKVMPQVIDSAQNLIGDFWLKRYEQDSRKDALSTMLESARMCEAFAALEKMSQDHYRVNLADAWHLAMG